MSQQLTITLDQKVYDKLQADVGANHISAFIESLLQPHTGANNLEAEYRRMAEDKVHEAQAMKWSKATIGDVNDETW